MSISSSSWPSLKAAIVGFQGTKPDDPGVQELIPLIESGRVGGIIFFAHNLETPQQAYTLLHFFKDRWPEVLRAVDQEGGAVIRTRWPGGSFRSPLRVAQSLGLEEAYGYYLAQAEKISDLGFNLVLAPCVDVHTPLCPVIGKLGRSFGEEANTIIPFAKVFIRAFEACGVACCLKHFPGHGRSREDSHKGPVDVTEVWGPDELSPYRELKTAAVMTSHITHKKWGDLPASLNAQVIQGMLRKKLGFQGKIISDDLCMAAALRSVPCGSGWEVTLGRVFLNALKAGNDYGILGFHPHLVPEKEQKGAVTRMFQFLDSQMGDSPVLNSRT